MSVHIDLINLERDADRKAHMQAAFLAVGVDLGTIHPAFDYRVEGAEAMEKLCRPVGPWGIFHKFNQACTISHMRAWQRFLASDATHGLFLEDDVFVAEDLADWLSDLSWWPPNADVVKIEKWRSKRAKILAETHSAHLGRSISRLLARHVGSAGYMMTRAAAQTALDAAPYDIPIDNLLFNSNASRLSRGFEIYQIHPALVMQGNEPPGHVIPAGTRPRPEGWDLTRQRLKRAYYELAYPLSTYWKYITGRAQILPITYEAKVS